MTHTKAELANACRRAEQESIAAIQATSAGAAHAHRELAMLHVARAQQLLRTAWKTNSTPRRHEDGSNSSQDRTTRAIRQHFEIC